jgi:hypothetical protein
MWWNFIRRFRKFWFQKRVEFCKNAVEGSCSIKSRIYWTLLHTIPELYKQNCGFRFNKTVDFYEHDIDISGYLKLRNSLTSQAADLFNARAHAHTRTHTMSEIFVTVNIKIVDLWFATLFDIFGRYQSFWGRCSRNCVRKFDILRQNKATQPRRPKSEFWWIFLQNNNW